VNRLLAPSCPFKREQKKEGGGGTISRANLDKNPNPACRPASRLKDPPGPGDRKKTTRPCRCHPKRKEVTNLGGRAAKTLRKEKERGTWPEGAVSSTISFHAPKKKGRAGECSRGTGRIRLSPRELGGGRREPEMSPKGGSRIFPLLSTKQKRGKGRGKKKRERDDISGSRTTPQSGGDLHLPQPTSKEGKKKKKGKMVDRKECATSFLSTKGGEKNKEIGVGAAAFVLPVFNFFFTKGRGNKRVP